MNKFDTIQKVFLKGLDSMGFSYEIIEIGDHPDNWYLEVTINTGEGQPITIKMEDTLYNEEYEEVEDRMSSLEDRVDALENQPNFINIPSFSEYYRDKLPSVTVAEWGTASCGGDCKCEKEDKPLTEAQIKANRESKRY